MEIKRIEYDDPTSKVDAEAAGRLLVEVYEPFMRAHEWWPRYQRELADVRVRAGETTVLIAKEGDAVLGTITVDTAFRWKATEGASRTPDSPADLRMLAVAQASAGKGVGTALMQAAIAHARVEGWQKIELHTMAAMQTAQRMYDRLGFVRDPARDDYDEDGNLLLLGYRLE